LYGYHYLALFFEKKHASMKIFGERLLKSGGKCFLEAQKKVACKSKRPNGIYGDLFG
jgi:hypothetical protein